MAREAAPLRTVDEHLAIVLNGIGSIEPIELTLLDAQGLLLAENVSADIPLPTFDNSSMDGYAVRAVDTRGASEAEPVVLPVIGDVVAGTKTRSGMGPGLAMRIMTGAPMPAGADAVIALEDTDSGVARVALHRPVQSGQYVRRLGEDLQAGAPALVRPSARSRSPSLRRSAGIACWSGRVRGCS
jgi:molybdopterin molybdotransferase